MLEDIPRDILGIASIIVVMTVRATCADHQLEPQSGVGWQFYKSKACWYVIGFNSGSLGAQLFDA